MFVVNANQTNTGYTNASVSGQYDIPMDGSVYTMFDSVNSPESTYNQCTGVYSGRDGNNPNEKSIFDNVKIKEYDQDVLFPYNMICKPSSGNSLSCYQFYSFFKTSYDYFLIKDKTTYHTKTEADFGTMEAKKVLAVASRKTFEGGEIVGKTIKSYIGASVKICGCCYGFWGGKFGYNGCYGGNFVFKGGPIGFSIDMGLLHKDGTKTSIKKIEYLQDYSGEMGEDGCIYYNGEIVDHIPSKNFYGFIMNGEIETDGAVACKGDRLYYEQNICPIHFLYDLYDNCDRNCSSYYILYNCVHMRVAGSDIYNINSGISCCGSQDCCIGQAGACSSSDLARFPGIQFSIE